MYRPLPDADTATNLARQSCEMKSRIPGCVFGVHVHGPPEYLLEGIDLAVLGGHVESRPTRCVGHVQLDKQTTNDEPKRRGGLTPDKKDQSRSKNGERAAVVMGKQERFSLMYVP